jgi:hypothetical protein
MLRAGSGEKFVLDFSHPFGMATGFSGIATQAVNKKPARLNCITHLLSLIPYKKVKREKVKLPKRAKKGAYDDQATLKGRSFVPEKY